MSSHDIPASILIVGSGVFGLSTAYALTQRAPFASSTITVLDRSTFPSPDGSSVDTSRIIRADYSDPAYAKLAAKGQREWRKSAPDDLGGEGRYTESGLMLVANRGMQGEDYVRKSLENVTNIMNEQGDAEAISILSSRHHIESMTDSEGGSGDWGYINRRSGWADASAGIVWLRKKVEAYGRVSFKQATVQKLLKDGPKVVGVETQDGSLISADLVILATGAWTGKLVDLRGRAQATGQVLCYLDITEEEERRLEKCPVLLNMSLGMFIIPPRNRQLKVARHGYGYSNPTNIPSPNDPDQEIEVSVPRTAVDDPNLWVPLEGEAACRQALKEMVPFLADRPFTKSKICWYTDTPKGDFLITYHPDFSGLFLATGGSGHGYKFLPVIGDKIVDCVEGNCPEEFREKWNWPKEVFEKVVTEDGSRGGRPGMILSEELQRGK